jgi:hypothetical protein
MVVLSSGPSREEEPDVSVETRNDGWPAGQPPTLSVAVPNMNIGDTIPLGKKTLQVVGKRDDDADSPPVLIVEEVRA